jgi:hypothetical protein
MLNATFKDRKPKMALPPSEEEIKAKHWWQFWRGG